MIDTILCPVDLTDPCPRALKVAGNLALRLGARVVLHHNAEAPPPSQMAVSWMWSEDHEAASEGKACEAAQRLEQLFAELPGVEVEAKLTRGRLDGAVVNVARAAAADLVVIETRGPGDSTHFSLTEKIVLAAPCPVLAIGETCCAPDIFAVRSDGGSERLPAVVPTDLTRLSARAIDYAAQLSRALPLELHLIHVLGPLRGAAAQITRAENAALDRLRKLVPDEMADRVLCTLASGGRARAVLAKVNEVDARLVIMAAHRKGPLRRAIFGTTTLELLHGCRCPILFLPEAMATSRFAKLVQNAVE